MEQTVITQILNDGTSSGIIQTNIDEWIGVSYKIPRNLFKDASKLGNIDKIGIYILFGQDDKTGKNIAYIGRSTNVYSRLSNHNKNKEFWSEAIVFVSQNNYLNESNIGYIESILVKKAKKVDRYIIKNEKNPVKLGLTNSDEIKSNKFLSKIELITSILGYKVFDEMIDKKDVKDNILYLTNNKIEYAKGTMTSEGFVILKGSKLKEGISEGISPSLLNFVERERKTDYIVNGVFKKNHLCTTPSMAAVLILGRNSNGYNEWKNKEGIKLKEIMLR